jgi:hypothetical protein
MLSSSSVYGSPVFGLFVASNGDKVALYAADATAATGYAVNGSAQYLATLHSILAVTQDEANPNKFYFIDNIFCGGTLTYSTSTQTLAITTYGTVMWPNYGAGRTGIVAMLHHGAKVFFVSFVHFVQRYGSPGSYEYVVNDVSQLHSVEAAAFGAGAGDANIILMQSFSNNGTTTVPSIYALAPAPGSTSNIVTCFAGAYSWTGAPTANINVWTPDLASVQTLGSVPGYSVALVSTGSGSQVEALYWEAIDSNNLVLKCRTFTASGPTTTEQITATGSYYGQPLIRATVVLAPGGPRTYVALVGWSPQVWKKIGTYLGWTYVGSIPSTCPAYPNWYQSGYSLALQGQSTLTLNTTVSAVWGVGNANQSSAIYYIDYGSLDTHATSWNIPTTPVTGVETFDQTTDTITLGWDHTDPENQPQTGAKVQVSENVPGATAKWLKADGTLSTTEVILDQSTQTANIAPNVLAASAAGYRWCVATRDTDGGWGVYSAWSTFMVAGRPAVSNVTSANITTNHPTVSWTYTDPESDESAAYRLILYSATDEVLWDSGPVTTIPYIVSGAAVSVLLSEYTLSNGTYKVGVFARDVTGVWSDESKVTFNCTASLPAVPTVTATVTSTGVATVTATSHATSNVPSAVTVEFFRFSDRLDKYVSLGKMPVGSVDGVMTTTITDYSTPVGTYSAYKAVVWGDNDSEVGGVALGPLVAGSDWLLLDQTGGLFLTVTGFSLTPDLDQETLEPAGRSNPVVTSLAKVGTTGDLSAFFSSDERDTALAVIDRMLDEEFVYLKSPFGETYKVVLSEPSTSLEVGGNARLTLKFAEIGDA